jgi:hypothetical protein
MSGWKNYWKIAGGKRKKDEQSDLHFASIIHFPMASEYLPTERLEISALQ